VEKETRLRGDIDCRPSLALRHPWPPDLPSPSPTGPRGRRGEGTMLNHRVGQLTTQRPSKERVRHRVHRATRLATILGTAGGQGPLEAAIGAATRPVGVSC
jgi:hypothetical protein